MLTGDKGSTAKTIAKNCGLLNDNMNINEIDEYNVQSSLS
jgi:magnesium-transporting ATPase (P-type)